MSYFYDDLKEDENDLGVSAADDIEEAQDIIEDADEEAEKSTDALAEQETMLVAFQSNIIASLESLDVQSNRLFRAYHYADLYGVDDRLYLLEPHIARTFDDCGIEAGMEGFIQTIVGFIKKIFAMIGNFFKKIFGWMSDGGGATPNIVVEPKEPEEEDKFENEKQADVYKEAIVQLNADLKDKNISAGDQLELIFNVYGKLCAGGDIPFRLRIKSFNTTLSNDRKSSAENLKQAVTAPFAAYLKYAKESIEFFNKFSGFEDTESDINSDKVQDIFNHIKSYPSLSAGKINTQTVSDMAKQVHDAVHSEMCGNGKDKLSFVDFFTKPDVSKLYMSTFTAIDEAKGAYTQVSSTLAETYTRLNKAVDRLETIQGSSRVAQSADARRQEIQKFINKIKADSSKLTKSADVLRGTKILVESQQEILTYLSSKIDFAVKGWMITAAGKAVSKAFSTGKGLLDRAANATTGFAKDTFNRVTGKKQP